MGKPTDRVKGNAKPSKSSQAADLISRGATSSFADFQSFPSFASSTADPDLDSELVVILRKFSKKDTTTRLKASAELKARIESDSAEDVTKILPKWAKLFGKLSMDPNRQIREAACQLHLTVIQKVKKAIAPSLKSFFPYWLCCLFDPNKEVSKLATEAFEAAFPPQKRANAIIFCKDELFDFLNEHLLKHTPETLSDPSLSSKEEIQSKYDRAICCSFLVLSFIINTLSDEENQTLEAQYRQIFEEKKTWSFSKHESILIRRSVYRLISSACRRLPSLVESSLKTLAPIALGFNETDPATHSDFWEAVLLFSKGFPHAWTAVDYRKALLPKMWKFLQAAGFGSSKITYPSLLPLLSTIPGEVIGTGPDFAILFLDNVRSGMKHETFTKEAARELLNSFLECLMFLCFRKNLTGEAQEKVLETEYVWLIELFAFPWKEGASLFEPATLEEKTVGSLEKLFSKSEQAQALFPVLLRFLRSFSSEQVGQALGEQGLDQAEVLAKLHQAGVNLGKLGSRLFILSEGDEERLDLLVADFKSKLTELETQDPSSTSRAVSLSFFSSFLESLPATTSLGTSLQAALFHSFTEGDRQWKLVSQTHSLSVVISSFKIFKALTSRTEEQAQKASWLALAQQVFSSIPSALSQVEIQLAFFEMYQSGGPAGRLSHPLVDETIKVMVIGGSNETEAHLDLAAAALKRSSTSLILSEEAEGAILEHLQSKLEELKVLPGQERATHDEALGVLELLKRCVAGRAARSTVSWLVQDRIQLVALIFDLKPWQKDRDLDLPAFQLSNGLWELLLEQISAESSLCASVRSQIARSIHFSLFDLTSNKSFILLAEQTTSLFRDLCHDAQQRSQILADIIPEKGQWRKIRENLEAQSAGGPLLVFRESNTYNGMVPILPQLEEAQRPRAAALETDPQGLSLYARLSLFTWELVSSQGSREFFAGAQQEASNPWLLQEILRARSLCTGSHIGLSLNPRDAQNLVWDASHSEAAPLVEGFLERSSSLLAGLMANLGESELQLLSSGLISSIRKIKQEEEDELLEEEVEEQPNEPNQILSENLSMMKLNPELGFLHEVILGVLLEASEYQKHELSKATTALCLDEVLTTLVSLPAFPVLTSELWLTTLLLDFPSNFEVSSALLLTFGKHIQPSSPAIQAFTTTTTSSFLKLQPSSFYSKDRNLRQSAWKALSLLNVSLQVCPILPEETILRLFDHSIRALSSPDNKADNPASLPANAEFARLMSFLVRRVTPLLLPNRWQYLFQQLESWILDSSNERENVEGRILLFQAFNLTQMIWDILESTSAEEKKALVPRWAEIQGDWGKCKKSIFGIILPVFLESAKDLTFERHQHNLLTSLSNVVSKIPEEILLKPRPFEELLKALDCWHQDLQKAGFFLLRGIAAVEVQELGIEEELRGASEEASPLPPHLASLIKRIREYGSKFQDQHSLLGDLLSWMLLFDFLDNQNPRLRFSYAAGVKEAEILGPFVTTLFEMMDVGSPKLHPLSQPIETFDLKTLDLEAEDPFFSLACHLYWRTLKLLPELVRRWWTECSDKNLRTAVESVTEKRFSPSIIAHQLSTIKESETLKFDNMVIKPSVAMKQVAATYSIEDVTISVVVKLPNTFPLRQIEVEGVQKVGVSEAQWRKWLLSMTTVISTQNGTIVDALKMWKQDADKKFEGIEECAICYYVVHASDRSLPKIACKTCKHKYHAGCLYKWFQSSSQSSCPLCRNIF